jgi:hypothetical protein
MEERVDLVGWLEFLVNGNVWINFFNDEYDNSFKKLIDEITAVEKLLATNPRKIFIYFFLLIKLFINIL